MRLTMCIFEKFPSGGAKRMSAAEIRRLWRNYEFKSELPSPKNRVHLPGARHFKGNMWHGRDRVILPVTPLDKARLLHRLDVERENMSHLVNPYITPEQEMLWDTEQERVELEKTLRKQRLNMPEHKFAEPHLLTLLTGKRWE